MHGDQRQARLWQISENLHRADLSVLERNEQIAEWLRLIEDGHEVSGQLVRKSRGGRPEGGLSHAARRLPVAGASEEARRKSVERAIRVDNISPKAKAAAIDMGLHNNQSALLAVAKQPTPEAQVEKLRELTKRKRKPRAKRAEALEHGRDARTAEVRRPLGQAHASDDEERFAWLKAAWYRASELVAAWAKAPSCVRHRFVSEVLRGRGPDAAGASDTAEGTLGRQADYV
jgi:ParB family chromosome partitioning protein